MRDLRRWIFHPWLNTRVQIALGLIFIVAATSKVMDPPAFAKAVWNYKLLPLWALHPVALTLPWLELFCGVALCLGSWVRAAAGWITGLLLVFTLALGINLARRHPVDCGCFTQGEPVKTESERLSDMRWAILRDLGLLLLAAHLLAASSKPEFKPQA